MAELTGLLDAWRGDLAAWAIPEYISATVTESPWVLPRQVFARRADRLAGTPSGASYDLAWRRSTRRAASWMSALVPERPAFRCCPGPPP